MILLFTLDISAQVTRASLWEWVSAQIIKSRTGVTSVIPSATNAVSLGSTDFIWSTGVSGTWTLGDDSDNVSGQLNFIASNNDAGNIAITTDDALTFNSFSGGYILDGYSKISGQLDVWQGSGISFLLGADLNAQTRTNSTVKIGRMGVPHYTTSEEPVAIFHANIQSTSNEINFGGGTSLMNAATILRFRTGATRTTTTGTTYLELNTSGLLSYFTGSGGSTTDSSIVFSSSSGSPVLNWYGTDGDTWNIGINTSDQATFNGASAYNFAGGSLILSGNISANAWTTNGIGLVRQAGTFTDLTSSGTVANAYTNVLGGNTIAASNATTFTNYYTTYINAPVAGTNVTITNPYALGVAGNMVIGSGAAGVDYKIDWIGESNQGSITYMEDEDRFDVDNDFKIGRYLYESVTAGITAGTTQSQGQQALVTSINEVATVGNANDVVTMPTAVAGLRVTIINNGANTLQIFPASGDNLGAGVDTSVTLVAGSNVTFVAYDDTNWEQL